MAYVSIPWPKEKTALYKLLRQRLVALTDGVKHPVSNLANASALLWDALPQINWVGFYLLEGDTLVLGPFQGKPACVEIATGKGVCGTAVAQDAVQLVPDVHAFPGHIACDGASRSEIVVPLHKDGKVAAVLDIDSPEPGRFDEADRDGLLELVSILEGLLP